MNTPQDSNYRQNAPGGTSGVSGGSVSDTAEELAQQARAQGQEQVQHYREMAADKVDTLADSINAAASELQDDDVGHLSQQIADMAGGLRSLSDGLREKSADQILRDVRRVARDNPTCSSPEASRWASASPASRGLRHRPGSKIEAVVSAPEVHRPVEPAGQPRIRAYRVRPPRRSKASAMPPRPLAMRCCPALPALPRAALTPSQRVQAPPSVATAASAAGARALARQTLSAGGASHEQIIRSPPEL
jgi:hypothetical protein